MGTVPQGEDVPLNSYVEAVCAPQTLNARTESLIPQLPGVGSQHSARLHVGTGETASLPKHGSLLGQLHPITV